MKEEDQKRMKKIEKDWKHMITGKKKKEKRRKKEKI